MLESLPDDSLTRFLRWFLTEMTVLAAVPFEHAVHSVERVTSVILFRDAPFQVQLFATQPRVIIPQHLHPNVDSYEVFMGGQMRFSKHGKWVAEDQDFALVDDKGLSKLRGAAIRVKPGDWHGGISGDAGAAFLSVQEWLNGVQPSCVANDYDGAVMGADHMAKVERGDAVLKAELSPRDAAHLEADVWPDFVGLRPEQVTDTWYRTFERVRLKQQ